MEDVQAAEEILATDETEDGRDRGDWWRRLELGQRMSQELPFILAMDAILVTDEILEPEEEIVAKATKSAKSNANRDNR